MRQSTLLRGAAVLAILGVAVAAAGCGGGGQAGTKDLVLVKFLLVDGDLNNIGGTGATNAFRDTRLLLEFNVPVDPTSVSDRTIQIGIPTGDGLLLQAPGRFFFPGDEIEGPSGVRSLADTQVLFDPTYTGSTVSDVRDNPFGLDANAFYEVRVPSVVQANKVVENLAGKGIVQGFTAAFQTSDQYLQNFVQPEVRTATVERVNLDGTRAQVDAVNATRVVPTSDVVLEFTEPMRPDSFKLGDTVIVRDLTNDMDVLGQLRYSADAKRVTFRPVFGYGKGPYEIFFRVKTEVTNLAGNPIPREVRFTFWTLQDDTQPDFEDITEEFEDTVYEDRNFNNQYPLAGWNQGVAAGFLAGTFTSGTITLSRGSSTYLWPPWAWGQNFSSQFQVVFYSSEVGGSPRTITGIDWYYRCLSAAVVSAVTINLGHSQKGSLTVNFATNFSDTPVAVVSNLTSYSIPSVPSEGWLPMPKFSQSFKYNGNDNLLCEIFNTCGSNGQNNTTWTGLWRVTTNQPTQRTAYTQPSTVGGGVPTTNGYYIDTRFNYLIDQSEAQSLFYDTQIGSPQFLDAVLFPSVTEQPAGTASSWQYQGGVTDPEDPSSPDFDNLSDWTPDLTQLSGYRFIRFRVTMKGNESTNQLPLFDSVILPFIFF